MGTIKARLKKFALISGGLLLPFIIVTGNLYLQRHGSLEDAALLLLMGLFSCLVGLVITIIFFTFLR